MRVVYGEGAVDDARAMLVGEAFGYFEQLRNKPFVGKSGAELDRYLERARIPRHECYVTNVCNFQPPVRNGKQLKPTRADIERELPRLTEEIHRVQPKWIMAIGKTAALTLTGRSDLQMEWCHAWSFPLAKHFQHDALVVPCYHPAAGLHNSQVARFVWHDIKAFGEYVNGTAEPVQPVDEHLGREQYIEFPSGKAFRYFTSRGAVGLDTEGLVEDPISVQLSSFDGEAMFIPAEAVLHDAGLSIGTLVGHNWLHDIHVCNALGLRLPNWDRVEDTMLMSFCIGTLPLGLKPLSRRVSGAIQQSYSEVTAAEDRKLALEWVERAVSARRCGTCEGSGKVPAYGAKGQLLKRMDRCPDCVSGGLWRAREAEPRWDWKLGKWKLVNGWEVGQYLRKLQKDLDSGVFDEPDDDEDDEQATDDDSTGSHATIRKRVKAWPAEVVEQLTEAAGELRSATLRDVPHGVMVRYACRDADLTLRNFPAMDRMIDEQGLRAAYRLDMDVIPAAAEMERNGIAVNVEKLTALGRRLRRENDVIVRKLQHFARRTINPASGDQVAALLFGERKLSFNEDDQRELQPHLSLELESEKMTRGGKREATDDKVLEGLKLKYADRDDVQEALTHITDYRVRDKIAQFAEKIARIAVPQPDGHFRIYTRIRPTTAATYRWATGDPINLQNIPTRNKGGADLGREMRLCFEAPSEDWVLCEGDYSQVELRVLAALSGDDELLRAFRDGIDPHVLGASRAWRMDYDDLYARYKAGDRKAADIRDSAKNLNFGIVFGITPRGLQAQMELRGLKYTLEECAELIRMWIMDVFPGIGEYIARVQSEGKLNGYVRTVMGHMRHCPGVWSNIPSIREEALRQLVNFTIQGTAAEVFKAGLRDVWRRGKPILDRSGSKILIAVHDSNLLQVRCGAEDAARMVLETYMANPLSGTALDGIEIEAKVKFGSNWAELKAA